MSYKPVALIILDGWGIREMVHGNAVVQANTPNFHNWLKTRERAILDASGQAVGLPDGQMGNSEVGHLNLGAGRIVYQDLTRINLAIQEGRFAQQVAIQNAVAQVKKKGSKLHLIGLMGDGGVHSHQDHLYALLRLAEEADIDPIVHVITDGRDTPPQSGLGFVEKLEAYLADHSGVIASVSGRYYTMDRDKRWERTAMGYRVIANHEGHEGATAVSASVALKNSYSNNVTDEFILPVAIDVGDRDVTVQPGDCLIFYNFRADRMRQPVEIFSFEDFDGFERDFITGLNLVTMTNYEDGFPADVIFPDVELTSVLAEVVSRAGLKQFHAAETEKYAHVTYFFNGGDETPFPGEERHLQPSPKVATYDLQPEMSAYELTEAVIQRIQSHDDDFILVNYANPDMVGHTGVLAAAVRAVEAVDECAGRLVKAIVQKGGAALVTADHGNCEIMINEKTGEPHTYHTIQPVSFFVICNDPIWLRPRGILADVAPTVLDLMGVEQPKEMTGRSLVD
ncbi:2,3-bisphosphoglycerate-independent phosphoglycerate mutase [Candidatus Leptofilum sp.]|uniref:2,3-bisphosphoglycerate-independent phosphoglycerate mutase n=1 Tax=Candidatus Leptofilum sp. TaxID=3241576 RepID=UPI003B58CEA9